MLPEFGGGGGLLFFVFFLSETGERESAWEVKLEENLIKIQQTEQSPPTHTHTPPHQYSVFIAACV